MSTHDSPTIRRFVRTAWIMLAFQLVFAAGAVGVAIWAASAVRQAVDQRDLLQARVAELEASQTRAAPVPGPAPVEVITPAPAIEPGPVNDVAPQPIQTAPPVRPTVRTPPPTRQPPIRTQPSTPPVYTPPPVYQPPVYVPPRDDYKPPETRDDPPPRRPRRPRINIDIPGLLGGGGSRDRPSRNPTNQNPRTPGTTSTNPNGRSSARPPATNVPNSTTVRRRPRPSANDPQPPAIR
jgi:hypothetical protein